MTAFFNRCRSCTAAGLAIIALTAMQTPAFARDVGAARVTIDMATGEFKAVATREIGQKPAPITSAVALRDGGFFILDLRLVLNKETKDEVTKMVDQGFTAEPSGCMPGAYGPLDMDDGLRYMVELNVENEKVGERKVRATIYPGNRSTHWTNDVFCEYPEGANGETAILRITGFFYVLHRKIDGGVDVQLRAITLTDQEIDSFSNLLDQE